MTATATHHSGPGGTEKDREEKDRKENLKRFQTLIEAIEFVHVPTSRMNFSSVDESAGMAMLDSALQLRHVYRITDHLSLIDNGHLRRRLALDIDLRQINPAQRNALRVRMPQGEEPRHVWIPVARQSRSDLAPVEVRDGHGAVIPRLTQDGLYALLTAGVVRVFRLQVEAEGRPGRSSNKIDDRSRWLIERAITTLVRQGRSQVWGDVQGLVGGETTQQAETFGDDAGSLHRIRSAAKEFLLKMPRERCDALADLFDIAIDDYFIVTKLDVNDPIHHISYDAPLMPASRPRNRIARSLKHWLPLSREFTMEYETYLPRSINAYHVTFEVDEQIRVRWFLLRSDADVEVVQALIVDLDRLAVVADRYHHYSPEQQQVHEMFAAETMARVAALVRRRRHVLAEFTQYTLRRYASAKPPSVSRATSMDELAALMATYERGHPLNRTPWRKIVAMIKVGDLQSDVSFDIDPRENGAHAHWQHAPLGLPSKTVESTKATVHVSMADEPPALLESVTNMVGGLIGVVGLLLLLVVSQAGTTFDVFGGVRLISIGSGDITNNDAIVAVLLLVPGILVSRLHIPSTHSVLGALRLFPIRMSVTALVVMGALATVTAMAEKPADLTVATTVAFGALALILAACLVERVFRVDRRHAALPRSRVVPVWMREAVSGPDVRRRFGDPDVRFEADGSRVQRAEYNAVQRLLLESLQGLIGMIRTLAYKALDQFPHVGTAEPEEGGRRITRSADLVRYHARALADGHTGVEMRFFHLVDGQRGYHRTREELQGVFSRPIHRDVLFFAALGVTFAATTRQISTSRAMDHPDFLVQPRLIGPGDESVAEVPVSQASAVVTLNPRRPGDGTHTFEILFYGGPLSEMTIELGRQHTRLLADVAALATQVAVVATYLHLPAAPPGVPAGDSIREESRVSHARAIRIGLRPLIPGGREQFLDRVPGIAERLGYDLYVGEYPTSHKQGQWRPIFVRPRPTVEAAAHQLEDARPINTDPVTSPEQRAFDALMVTIIGPATGNTAAVMSKLAAFFNAWSVASYISTSSMLQGTVVLNTLLPVSPEAVSGVEVHELLKPQNLVQYCRTPGAPDPGASEAAAWPSSQFHVVLVTPVHLRAIRAVETHPFWLTWVAPADTVLLKHIRDATIDAFAELGYDAQLAFLRAYRTAAENSTGMGKIAVRPVNTAVQVSSEELATLAKRVAQEVRLALVTRYRKTPEGPFLADYQIELRVAWGERWLGWIASP